MKKLVILAAAMTLGVVLALGAGLYVRGTAGPDAVAAAVDQIAPGTGGVQQGIAVKGHWTIEVRNPDGTQASRSEFDNAFENTGKDVLVRLLTRYTKISKLVIRFDGPTSPCIYTSGGAGPCKITHIKLGETPNAESNWASYNLVMTGTTTGLRLSGSKVVSRDGSIQTISTNTDECYWNFTEAQCIPQGTGPATDEQVFTQHDLGAANAIPVVVGQQVLVTVDLSFVAAT